MGLAFAGMLMASCADSPTAVADYQVVPMPLEITAASQGSFLLKSGETICYTAGNEKMKKNAEFLAAFIKEQTGIALKVAEGDGEEGIVLRLGLEADSPEAYRLKVDDRKVEISAPSEAGVFYGIQTLRKSVSVHEGAGAVELPAVEINDSPRFSYRGMMLDVGRHMFSMDEIKTYIDMLALHNINRFHWHLSEDQGWRIEIKKYPKLTEIGSKRSETVIGRNSGEYDGKPYGGFYTQEQAREIVAYAAERYITVIPEIDLPGHMQAALAAYPELGCTGGPYEVWRMWGISDNVLCAGNDKTIQFIKDVLAEIIDIFPSEYIHVGGDECPKVKWETCPKCQARIKALGIKGDSKHSKEEYLQSYVIHEAEKFLTENGRSMIGWDEILEGGLAPNATVMVWRGEEGGVRAVKAGHRVVMTPGKFCYLDSYQDAPQFQPEASGGYLPLANVYSYDPVSPAFTEEEAKLIYGVQGNLWAEYIPTDEHYEYMAYPRLLAIAEVAWSAPANKSYPDFRGRVCREIGWLRDRGYHPFPLEQELGERPEAKERVVHLALGKPVVYNAPYNEHYKAQGDKTLTDGIRGGWTYSDGAWQGFISRDRLDVTIDLGKAICITSVEATFIQVVNPEVFLPCEVIVSFSTDGKNFVEAKREEYKVSKEKPVCFGNFGWTGCASTRYVRYQARSDKDLRGWLFTDEIIVK